MKKDCLHWKEYESIAGVICYCERASFNKKTHLDYLDKIGCSKKKRERCLEMMERNTGFGLTPAAETEKTEAAEKVALAEINERVLEMKKLVNCKNWAENEGLTGAVMFCSAGAYGKALDAVAAKELGCTALKREKCLVIMEKATGFGLVPMVETEITEIATVAEKTERYELAR